MPCRSSEGRRRITHSHFKRDLPRDRTIDTREVDAEDRSSRISVGDSPAAEGCGTPACSERGKSHRAKRGPKRPKGVRARATRTTSSSSRHPPYEGSSGRSSAGWAELDFSILPVGPFGKDSRKSEPARSLVRRELLLVQSAATVQPPPRSGEPSGADDPCSDDLAPFGVAGRRQRPPRGHRVSRQSTRSTSAGYTLKPPVMIISFDRPTIWRYCRRSLGSPGRRSKVVGP